MARDILKDMLSGKRDIGWSSKREKERDTRRAFSQSQKSEIWDRQKGICRGSHCGHSQLLRAATHYDHIKPHEDGGKTIVKNGQALCATCHALKSNKDRLKKVDKKRKGKIKKNTNYGFITNLGKKRNKKGFLSNMEDEFDKLDKEWR